MRVSQSVRFRELDVAPALAALVEIADVLTRLQAAIVGYEAARAEYEALTQVEHERTRAAESDAVLARLEAVLARRRGRERAASTAPRRT